MIGSGKSTNLRACMKLLSKLREESGGPKAITLEEMATTTQRALSALGSARNSTHAYSTRYICSFRFTVNVQNKKTLGFSVQTQFLETSRLWALANKGSSFLIFTLLKTPAILAQVPGANALKDIFASLPSEDISDNEEDCIKLPPYFLR